MKDEDILNNYYPPKQIWQSYNERLKNYPDSNLVNMDKYYFPHPAFDEYPVTGISIELANAYCKWLTEQYNKNSKTKIIFRLPTFDEWEVARSNQGISYSVKNNCDSVPGCNIRSYSFCAHDSKSNLDSTILQFYLDGFMFTSPVCSFPPNSFGLYDLLGNVSEVVTINGEYKVIGGNWDTYPDMCNNLEVFRANQPTIGFRIFMEVLQP